MARYIGPVCRLCRREGVKLFLKGQKCLTEKCPLTRRKTPPGQPPQRRPRISLYAMQLREKQKVKRFYGVLEKQFRRYFAQAQRMKGLTGENLLILLERRLDNVLYRGGLAASRRQARNFIVHRHVLLNGKKMDIPSYLVKVGDEISLTEKMKNSEIIQQNIELAQGVGLIPEWLELIEDERKIRVKELPRREHVDLPVEEHLIVELYSK